MFADGTLLAILAVIFLATLVRSAFGFGDALVAVPLLALVVPVEVATPLVVLVSVTIAGFILAQDWRHVQFHGAWRLVVATAFGIPLGLLLLKAVAEPIVKAGLGVLIIGFSTYCLASRRPFTLRDDRLAWAFGFVAGVLGGAYGMNGPPLVVYGTLRRWPGEHFRATLQGYFLPASLMGLAGYWLAGLWVPDVTRYYLLSLSVTLPTILLGRLANRRFTGSAFVACVHVGLILIGAALLVQTVWKYQTRPDRYNTCAPLTLWRRLCLANPLELHARPCRSRLSRCPAAWQRRVRDDWLAGVAARHSGGGGGRNARLRHLQ